METLYQIPDIFTAGSTVIYRRSYQDFPVADGWTLTLYLKGASSLEQAAATSGNEFIFTLTAAATAALESSAYRWTERASLAGQVFDAGSGNTYVLPDPDQQVPGDAQTQEEKLLAEVDAEILRRITSGVAESYSIGSRAVQKMKMADLIELRSSLAAIVAQQRGDGSIKAALVFFTGTTLTR